MIYATRPRSDGPRRLTPTGKLVAWAILCAALVVAVSAGIPGGW